MLPSPSDDRIPCSRHLMKNWWKKAERLAGLEPMKGRGWHSLRRKFATELKDEPPEGADAAGPDQPRNVATAARASSTIHW